MTKLIKSKICIMFFIVALIILLVIGFSSALIYNEKINEGASSVSSDQALTCYWKINSDGYANVTWYQNGAYNKTQENIYCSNGVQCSTNGDGNVPASFTTRGDNWKCSINNSQNENTNVSVNISNSPPEPPRIFFYANNTEIYNYVAIQEDNVTEFIVNSTDADEDSIIYTLNDTTYCTIDASSGIMNCTPTANSTVGVRKFKIGAEDDWSAQFTNLTINVTPVNDPPDFTISNQSTKQNQTLNITFTTSDEEPNYPLNILVSSNASCISSYGRIGTSDNSFYIYCNPVPYIYEVGNYTVYVNITDSPTNMSDNRTTSRNFTLEITSVNHNPNITTSLINTTGTQNQNYTLTINATDLDNNTLTFSTAAECPLSNPWSIYYQNSTYNSTTNTTNAYAIINLTLTNSHIACRNITFTVNDGAGGNDTRNILLNLTNINDNPIIYNESYYATNLPAINIYLQNLTAYEGAPFSYRINATDPDTLTYEGDNLLYTANETFINSSMNHATGLISFTPNSSYVGNHTIKITVKDNHGATYNATMNLNITANAIPYFTAMPNFTCAEYDATNYPYYCFINISEYANDTADDNVTYYEDNTSIFNINSTTGIINFSVLQSSVGNHTINITIYDTKNASNSTKIYLQINATNNPPSLTAIDLSTISIVETYPITYSISASDSDLGSTIHENLVFNMISNNGTILFLTLQQNSNTSATLIFNPQLGDAGNYSINISVTDYYSNVSEQTYINFTVLNKTEPSNISSIKPYGTPIGSYTVFDWYVNNLTNFPNKTTEINLSENLTVSFNANVSDESASVENLILKWYLDNALNKTANGSSSSNALNLYFGFFASGMHNLTLVVSNPYYENNSFSWLINLSNTNRNPELKTLLENKSNINGTTTYSSYLSTYNTTPQRGFYDPDDDLNNNGSLDGNEINHLNYTYNQTLCNNANITISGNDLTINPSSIGVCNITIIANDSEGLYVNSNIVAFNIIDISNGTQKQQQQNIYTSRTTTITQTITIPLPEEVEKPKPLKILAPKVITIYQNKTIKIPIKVQNTWNDTLKIIYLTAEANVSNVTFRFERNYFPSLAVGEIRDTSLEVFNYREGGPYEIIVQANVSEPPYTDTATIYINSLEKLSEGDEIATKISFARDLLTQNPECEELNELLSRAEKEMQNGNFEESKKLIDGVINGCKYLVEGVKKANNERPSKILQFFFNINRKYINYGLVALLAIILVIGLYYVFMRAPKNPPENQNKQNVQNNENIYSNTNRNIPRNY